MAEFGAPRGNCRVVLDHDLPCDGDATRIGDNFVGELVDENITFQRVVDTVGSDLAQRIRDISIRLYSAARDIAAEKGIIIADTKFEFGLDADGTLTLMDEVLTPDSSRYWPVDGYAQGSNPPSFDKQFLRDWLETAQINGQAWGKTAPAPALPPEVIAKTSAKYQEAFARLTS